MYEKWFRLWLLNEQDTYQSDGLMPQTEIVITRHPPVSDVVRLPSAVVHFFSDLPLKFFKMTA